MEPLCRRLHFPEKFIPMICLQANGSKQYNTWKQILHIASCQFTSYAIVFSSLLKPMANSEGCILKVLSQVTKMA